MATTIHHYIKHRKEDGTYKVYIEITHKRQRAYIPTSIYVTDKDLTKDLKFRKSFYSLNLERLMAQFREYIAELGVKIEYYTVEDVKDYILRKNDTQGGKFINFIDFCVNKCNEVKTKKGKNGTYYMYHAAIVWLKKFNKSDSLNISDISRKYLEKFSDYLREQKTGEAGINANLRAIRTLFRAAMNEYNDESRDEYMIKHYPFRNFKIKEPVPEKRNIEVHVFRQIITQPCRLQREKTGQDMLLLCFLLAGIAPIDLYNLTEIKDNYITYYRRKVQFRDNKIKVKIYVCKQAQDIIKEYSKRGFLSEIKKYSTAKNFAKACGKGLKSICKKIDTEKVSLYWSRHTFSSVAAEIGYDSNLIDYVLGHAPGRAHMAEIYITRKQSSVDKLVQDVIDFMLNV
ncbi:MAG: site-specific integrase [Prevotellaceae bacterium]|jgi:site-specific recombinase XerD|nr:site-specific integrase [Prevotellaceae bacterium]